MHAHLQKENYFHHNDYGPSKVCDVYHIEHVTHSGFDLSITDNSYCLSPQHMIKDQDYEALCPYVLLLPIDHIKHTLSTTTQWLHSAYCIPIHKHFKCCFLAANVSCHNEPIATDTVCSDEPVLGSKAQAAMSKCFQRRHLRSNQTQY